jgi:heme-degrading monooxygenase HmoA
MIARLWHGIVPAEKADDYTRYLAGFGVRDYQAVPGNRGVQLLRRREGPRVHFLLLSLWVSREAIEAYAGPDIDQARYYPYDLECLIDPASEVAHYEVVLETGTGGS